MPSPPPPNRKGRPKGSSAFAWRAFFQQSHTPVFVLGKGRRLRYANPAWEQLAGVKLADALGLVCSTRRHSTPLAVALAPTPEALAGRPEKVRRAAPQHRTGPPWWDVTFAPLAGDDGLYGLVGFIEVVGEAVPAAARKIPAGVMAQRDKHAAYFTLDLFAGSSPLGERFVGQLRLASQLTTPVWLVGELGSGKETAARVIHHTGTQRERAFLALDCAGLQPFLIESLLAGHGGLLGTDRAGTVYLKDPAALPRDVQERLAELFTEDMPRLICGSVYTAAEEVKAGRLVPAFHTTLSVLELRVPPLRERTEDAPRFISHLLPNLTVEPAAIEVLKALPWPGNLRELRAVLADAAAAAGDKPIQRDHLPFDLRVKADLNPTPPAAPSIKLDETLEAVEKRMIRLAMKRAKGNATKAAEMLGIWRPRLLRRIEALGLNQKQ